MHSNDKEVDTSARPRRSPRFAHFTVAGVLFLVALSPFAASAATLDELTARLTKLETENAELKAEVRQLRSEVDGAAYAEPAAIRKIPAPPIGEPSTAVERPVHTLGGWTGPYVGVNFGYDLGQSSGVDASGLAGPTIQRLSGTTGGAQVGADLEVGRVVLGLQGGASLDGVAGRQSVFNNTVIGSALGGCRKGTPNADPWSVLETCDARQSFTGEIAVRAGYTFLDNKLLPYFKGGISTSSMAVSYNEYIYYNGPGTTPERYSGSNSKYMVGIFVGTGLEYKIQMRTSFGIEYLFRGYGDRAFSDLGHYSFTPGFGGGGSGTFASSPSMHDRSDQVVRVFVNYHLAD